MATKDEDAVLIEHGIHEDDRRRYRIEGPNNLEVEEFADRSRVFVGVRNPDTGSPTCLLLTKREWDALGELVTGRRWDSRLSNFAPRVRVNETPPPPKALPLSGAPVDDFKSEAVPPPPAELDPVARVERSIVAGREEA